MGCNESQPQKELTPERIAQALAQALEMAAAQAVAIVSQDGGFLNTKLRIAIPGELGEVMAKCKILPGLGGKVEELEVNMNKAAEQAAKLALDILVSAIRGLNFENAKAILDGADDAATQYFIGKTRTALFDAFSPIINSKMAELGVVTIYDTLMSAYGALPFTKKPDYNLSGHVTNKALEGLFLTFADQERAIRGLPEKRGDNEAVKEVFGSKDGQKKQQ